jgi:hypothetical protein
MITKLLERYNFTDDHGHKLELCTDYHALLQMADYGTQQVYCINYDAKVNLKTDSLWITGLIGYFPVTIGGNNG